MAGTIRGSPVHPWQQLKRLAYVARDHYKQKAGASQWKAEDQLLFFRCVSVELAHSTPISINPANALSSAKFGGAITRPW